MLGEKGEGPAALGRASLRRRLRAWPRLQPPRLRASAGRAAPTGQLRVSNPGTDSNVLLPGCRTSLPRPAETGTRCARLGARQLRAPPPTRASFGDLRAGRRRGCCAGGRGRRTETRPVQQAVGRGGASRAPGHAPWASRGTRGLGTGGKTAPSASGALAGGRLAGVSPRGLCWLRLQCPGAFPPSHAVSRARPSRADAAAGSVRHLDPGAADTAVAETPGAALRARFLRGHGWVLVWDNETKLGLEEEPGL